MVCTLEKLKARKKFLNEPSPKHWKNETDDVKYNKGKTLQLPNKCSLASYSIKTRICFQKIVLLSHANSSFSRKALYNLPIWPLLVMLQRFRSFEDCLN